MRRAYPTSILGALSMSEKSYVRCTRRSAYRSHLERFLVFNRVAARRLLWFALIFLWKKNETHYRRGSNDLYFPLFYSEAPTPSKKKRRQSPQLRIEAWTRSSKRSPRPWPMPVVRPKYWRPQAASQRTPVIRWPARLPFYGRTAKTPACPPMISRRSQIGGLSGTRIITRGHVR